MVSQPALLPADQPQPSAVRMSNEPVPPDAAGVADVVESENAQPCPWFTVKVRPAIVSVPERPGPFVDATVKATVPFPVPLPPEVIEIHGTLLAALQPQPAGALTDTEPLPPEGAIDCVSAESANEHPSPCVMLTVCPAIVSVPERGGPVVGATATDTLPLPLPDDVLSVSQGTLLDAVQGQPVPAVTITS